MENVSVIPCQMDKILALRPLDKKHFISHPQNPSIEIKIQASVVLPNRFFITISDTVDYSNVCFHDRFESAEDINLFLMRLMVKKSDDEVGRHKLPSYKAMNDKLRRFLTDGAQLLLDGETLWLTFSEETQYLQWEMTQ